MTWRSDKGIIGKLASTTRNPPLIFCLSFFCSKYYEKYALVYDADYGSILSSLLGNIILHSLHILILLDSLF